MLTKTFYIYIITILICMGLLWTIRTSLPYWYASGCYELSYVDCVLIPVERGFLVNCYSYRVLGYLFLMDWCPLLFVLDCCNTVFRSPDLSDWVLVILLFVLFTSYLQTTVLVFFSFYAASFTEACFYRCALDMFELRICSVADFPWIPFSCVHLQCLVWTVLIIRPDDGPIVPKHVA
jgi:hypothetical protein